MMRARALFAALLLLACVGASSPKLTLTVGVARGSFDLLDTVSVTISVWITEIRRLAAFPQTSEYAIDVLDGTTLVSTTLASPVPIGIPHSRAFSPGVIALAVYDFNVIRADRSVPDRGPTPCACGCWTTAARRRSSAR